MVVSSPHPRKQNFGICLQHSLTPPTIPLYTLPCYWETLASFVVVWAGLAASDGRRLVPVLQGINSYLFWYFLSSFLYFLLSLFFLVFLVFVVCKGRFVHSTSKQALGSIQYNI